MYLCIEQWKMLPKNEIHFITLVFLSVVASNFAGISHFLSIYDFLHVMSRLYICKLKVLR